MKIDDVVARSASWKKLARVVCWSTNFEYFNISENFVFSFIYNSERSVNLLTISEKYRLYIWKFWVRKEAED